jgi:hypothetical protein
MVWMYPNKKEVYLDIRDKILSNMKKVDCGYKTKCWLWTGGSARPDGRGVFTWAGKQVYAWHAAYEEWIELVPKDKRGKPTKWVLHRCHQGTCVNPFHLYLGTSVDNARDREERYTIEEAKLEIPMLKWTTQRTETPMKELYNCKTVDPKHYRITKFDNHLNPKHDHTGRMSSYVVSETDCECPQGHAHSCRHRKMLPFFIEHDYVDTEYFFVWDLHQWYKAPTPVAEVRKANGKDEPPRPHKVVQLTEEQAAQFFSKEEIKQLSEPTDIDPPLLHPYEGGPSQAPSPQPSPTKTFRRF